MFEFGVFRFSWEWSNQVQCFEVSDGLVRLVLGLGGDGKGKHSTHRQIKRGSHLIPQALNHAMMCYHYILSFSILSCSILFVSNTFGNVT